MNKRKTIARVLTFAISAVCVLPAFRPTAVKAEDYWPEGPSIESESAVVMEVNTGTILYEKNSQEKKYPASITKIMTTLLALENSSLHSDIPHPWKR